MLPSNNWEWFGHAGHLIVGYKCRFHLCTLVKNVIVSTVGEYVSGIGTDRTTKFETIGFDRLYETMVFRADTQNRCKAEGCNCGIPNISRWTELDFDGYNTAGEATQGHYKMCEKWETLADDEEGDIA